MRVTMDAMMKERGVSTELSFKLSNIDTKLTTHYAVIMEFPGLTDETKAHHTKH